MRVELRKERDLGGRGHGVGDAAVGWAEESTWLWGERPLPSALSTARATSLREERDSGERGRGGDDVAVGQAEEAAWRGCERSSGQRLVVEEDSREVALIKRLLVEQ